MTVSARLNDFGLRPVLRNNVLSTWQVNNADEPNGITGFDGNSSSSNTEPVGTYSAFNGGLDFQSFFKDRFPSNNISSQGFGSGDLPSVPLDKFTDVFDPDDLEVSNQWLTGASDGGKLGIRWSGTNLSYNTLRAQVSDWWSTMNMQAQNLAASYEDTDGTRRPAANASYVIKDQDNRPEEITSVDIVFNPNTTSYVDQTLPVSSTIVKDSSTTVSYEWSLKRAGGGAVLFGATITATGDNSTAELYTGALGETDTEMDDLQIVLKVTTTNGSYVGWRSVSDTSAQFIVADSVAPSTGDYAGELDGASGTGGAVDNNPTTSLYNASRVYLKGSDAGTGGQGFNIQFATESDRDDLITLYPSGYNLTIQYNLNQGAGLQTATCTGGGWNAFGTNAKASGGTWTGLPASFWVGGSTPPPIYSMQYSNP